MTKIGTLVALMLVCGMAHADETWGLKSGKVELKSASVLAFGPNDVLFVGDTKAATIFAIATGDKDGDPANARFDNKNIQSNLDDMFGGKTKINDLVVNPKTGNLFIACEVDGKAKIVHVTDGGRKMTPLVLGDTKSQVPY
jgi:sugar lactone lactonase YvrE